MKVITFALWMANNTKI